MSKKRTRKQKMKAKARLSVRLNEGIVDKKPKIKKEQVKKIKVDTPVALAAQNKTKKTKAKISDTISLKRDISKSLTIAGVIIALEFILYIVWRG